MVESAIYRAISPELSTFLHESGFVYDKRHFKLFTFSRIFGQYRISGEKMIFSENASLLISSPLERFIMELANGILKGGGLRIGETKVRVNSIYFPNKPRFGTRVLARTLSPITVYSTLLTGKGNKKTYYYSPYEAEFSNLLGINAIKKASLVSRRKIKDGLVFKPVKMKDVVVIYKGIVVKGSYGIFELNGAKTLIDITYDAGLGSKNPEGFGMYEIIKSKNAGVQQK